MLDHVTLLEKAAKIAEDKADLLYSDRESDKWKTAKELIEYREYRAMITPPDICSYCGRKHTGE